MSKKSKRNHLVKSAKAELQQKIIEASKSGVVLINEEDLKSLGLVFGKKDTIVASIEDVLFIAYKLVDEDNKFEYILQRRLDSHNKPHDTSFIHENQAKKIGLHEGIEKVKIGEDLYAIHYVNVENLPLTSKNFVLQEKAPKIKDEKFLYNKDSFDVAQHELENFFEELRQWDKKKDKLLENLSEPPPKTKLVKDKTGRYVNIVELAPKVPPGANVAKNIQESDHFNIQKVNKTGYNYLSDDELFNLSNYVNPKYDVKFSYGTKFRNLNNFWSKLNDFYAVSAFDLDQKFRKIVADNFNKPVFDKEQVELEHLLKSKLANPELELNKQLLLKEEKTLNDKLVSLSLILKSNNIELNESKEFVKLSTNLKDVRERLKHIDNALNLVNADYEHLFEKYKDFKFRSYVDVSARPEILSSNKEKIGSKVQNFDEQLNDIEYAKRELEEILIQKVRLLHEAKKVKTRLELAEQEKLAQLQELGEASNAEEVKHLEALITQGKISENTAIVQRQIELEQTKLDNSLATLKEFASVENYEEKLLELKTKQEELTNRKLALDKELLDAKVALVKKQKEVSEKLKAAKHEVYTLESEIVKLIHRFRVEVEHNNEATWASWNEGGVSSINEIFTKKVELLSQISDIVTAQIDRLSVEQMKVLELALDRQSDWERVYSEATAEFKAANYYVPEPESGELTKKDFESNEFIKVDLSPAAQKIIDFPIDLGLSDKKDSLLGLDPKTKNDDEFLLIDQVWEKLTPEQEEQLAKNLAEKQLKEKDALEASLEESKLAAEQQELMEGEVNKAKEEQEKIDKLILEDQARLEEKLRKEEKEALEVVQYRNKLNSNVTGEFKDEIFTFAKKLIKNKQVELVSTKLVITDSGLVDNASTTVYTDKDFFLKPRGISFDGSETLPDSLKEYQDDGVLDAETVSALEYKIDEESSTLAEGPELLENAAESLTEGDSVSTSVSENEPESEIPVVGNGVEFDSESAVESDFVEVVHETDEVQEVAEDQEVAEEQEVVEELEDEKTKNLAVGEDAPTVDEKYGLETVKEKEETIRYLEKIKNLDLSELKRRIKLLDDEIKELSKYTSNQASRVQRAIEIRDELKRQFNEELSQIKLEFGKNQEEIDDLLSLESKEAFGSQFDKGDDHNRFSDTSIDDATVFEEPKDSVLDKNGDPVYPSQTTTFDFESVLSGEVDEKPTPTKLEVEPEEEEFGSEPSKTSFKTLNEGGPDQFGLPDDHQDLDYSKVDSVQEPVEELSDDKELEVTTAEVTDPTTDPVDEKNTDEHSFDDADGEAEEQKAEKKTSFFKRFFKRKK